MTRLSPFNNPYLLGFDHFERMVDRISRASNDGYPPYNIERVGEDELRITLAVAGFARDDLEIQVEDNQLVIRGKQGDDGERVYLHRGIAARQFQRAFLLAEGMEVTDAQLDNGLLHIGLRRPVPESRVRTIDIRAGGGRSKAAETIDVTPDKSSSDGSGAAGKSSKAGRSSGSAAR